MQSSRMLEDYQVTPRILRSGEETVVTIRPLGGHAAFAKGQTYTVKILPLEGHLPIGEGQHPREECMPGDDGTLRVPLCPWGEQEIHLQVFEGIYPPEERIRQKPTTVQALYCLQPDLFALRPYRGDLHAHTMHSDGRETPDIVAANYRQTGFDFLAITDHGRYEPSLEAMAAYRDAPVDIALYPGEEVHAPDNNTHIVHVGGRESINDVFRQQPEEYARQVDAIRQGLTVPEGVNPTEAAATHWAMDRIRQAGGLAIFPHPHWLEEGRHIRDAFSRYLFHNRVFDAFELLGGQTVRENNLQTAFYSQMRAEGVDVPVVGSSDSHGTVEASWFNWMSTMVFAKSLDFADVRAAVLDGYSVAVEHYPGETPRAHGPYRLVKYALFLLDAVFPLHDQLCYEEGLQMKRYRQGDAKALERLEALQGRCQRMWEEQFTE